MQGNVSLVLHAHLPFVRHPEHEEFLEEDWLYEAITETYLPILDIMERLINDKINFRLTMSLTPPLISMLRDELLINRYVKRLENLLELCEKEVTRTYKDSTFNPLAEFYFERLHQVYYSFCNKHKKDLVASFARLQEQGSLEIITCAATHGYLPLMQITPQAVKAQISVAVSHYQSIFNRRPVGFWLPECGYYPGVERFLAAEGIRYFFLDSHGILDATPRPRYGVYAPLYTSTGTAAFGRDPQSSQQVWSADHGYPGDYWYREFYRDIGFDLDIDYLKPYIQSTGARKNIGIKYYRITGKTRNKEPYVRSKAMERVVSHATHFISCRNKQIEQLASAMGGRKPIIVAPYDAELFGHWWFEGPEFIDNLFRKSATQYCNFRWSTITEYLAENRDHQLAAPPPCSWGAGGYNEVWLDGCNDWIYHHSHKAAARMVALTKDFAQSNSIEKRALNQAARELLLAQASDWAFIIKTGTMVEYARKRTREHLLRFNKLHDQIRNNMIDEQWLCFMENKDNIFPNINYNIYRV